MAQPWKTGLFDCFSDCGICITTIFCSCIQYGQNQERLDGSGCCGHCCIFCCCRAFSCFFHGSRRTQLRSKYGLAEEPCGDCMVTWCCSPCAICQEAREMNLRGAPGGQAMV